MSKDQKTLKNLYDCAIWSILTIRDPYALACLVMPWERYYLSNPIMFQENDSTKEGKNRKFTKGRPVDITLLERVAEVRMGLHRES